MPVYKVSSRSERIIAFFIFLNNFALLGINRRLARGPCPPRHPQRATQNHEKLILDSYRGSVTLSKSSKMQVLLQGWQVVFVSPAQALSTNQRLSLHLQLQYEQDHSLIHTEIIQTQVQRILYQFVLTPYTYIYIDDVFYNV